MLLAWALRGPQSGARHAVPRYPSAAFEACAGQSCSIEEDERPHGVSISVTNCEGMLEINQDPE